MQVKSLPIIMKALAAISMVLILSLAGCTKSTVDESEDISIFDAKAHSILSSSLAPIPDSLVIQEEDEKEEEEKRQAALECLQDIDIKKCPEMDGVDFGLMTFKHNSDIEKVNTRLSNYVDDLNAPNEAEVQNYGVLFDVARDYGTAASAAREQIKMFIESFIPSLTSLKDVELPIVLPDYLVGKFGLYQIVIEASGDPEYTWKIGLHYTELSVEPEVAFSLALNEAGGKGRMYMEMKDEEDSYAAEAGIAGIKLTRKVEAIFDGTGSPQKFEFKYVGDRSEARKYAREHWEELSDAAKDALTGIPDKIFLTINYNQTDGTHEVYGASYHPGWAALKELEGQSFWNNESRTIYMFKAKSLKTQNKTSMTKLALALPPDTNENANVWGEHAVGEIFAGMVESQLNAVIPTLNDDVNNCPPYALNQCVVDHGGDVYHEPEGTLPLYSGEASSERQRATVMYDCIMDDCVVENGSDSIPDNPHAIIKKDELENFVYDSPITPLFEKVTELYEQCRVISYMVNPAFFNNEGLVGTYNDRNEFFYDYDYQHGIFDDGASNIDPIQDVIGISLSGVGSYTPKEVKGTDIAP